MTALRSVGRSEAFADRRTAAGIIATLAMPVGFLAFFAQGSIGQLGGVAQFDPVTWAVAIVAAGFVYAVANSAFAAATLRRRTRYELLTSVGAQRKHITELLRWELGFPAALGIGVGFIIGIVAAELVQPFAATFDPGEVVGLTVSRRLTGFISGAGFVIGPAAFGVWVAALSAADRVGEPRGTVRPSPQLDIARYRRAGLIALAISVPLLLLSVLAFSFTFADGLRFLDPFSEVAWLGLIVGVIAALLGVSMLIPSMLTFLAQREATGGVASALKGLADNPRRAMGFTAGVLALSTLTVMAAAGILSDADQVDDPGDRRQIVSTEAGISSGFVEEVAERHNNAIAGIARFRDFGGPFFERRLVSENGASTSFTVAGLTDDLIAVLRLSADDVEFARQGGLLVDSDIIEDVVTIGPNFETTTVEVRRVRRGGGVRQPGPEAYAFLEDREAPIAGLPTFSLVRFEEPLSPAMIGDLQRGSAIREVPRGGGEFENFGLLALGLVAVLLFSLALSASNLAAVELDEEFSTMVALGASPNVRSRTLALQLAWQLGLGVVTGSALGVLLFWVVTRGDPSVPNAIVPFGAIGALGGASIAAVAMAALFHGPAEPAVSSRVAATVEV